MHVTTKLLLALALSACLGGCVDADCGKQLPSAVALTIVDAQGQLVAPDEVQLLEPGDETPRPLEPGCTDRVAPCYLSASTDQLGTYTVFVQVGDQKLQRDVEVTERDEDGCHIVAQELTLVVESP